VRIALFALLGLIFGSFLTVVVHRVPRGESVVRPRSRCPRCGSQIRPIDNVPVVSYMALRGRCRECGARVSPEYPLTELATGILFAAAAAAHQDLFVAVLVAMFLAAMLAVALVDARWRIVPNRIVYPALLVALGSLIVGHLWGRPVDATRGLVGVAIYAGPMFLVAVVVPHGMGMGDVKLAALIGLVLGSLGLAYVAVGAGLGIVIGGLGAIVAMVVFRFGRKQQIPFGPFLAGGAAVAALAGRPIADLYLSLLGA
jgi:leader peptidase (prepilin peptidase)/N-methyltransferase